ncbi:MAG: NAD(P)/FAD-dependent oxidoreductase, partial [Verrucomicrobiales bacterium]
MSQPSKPRMVVLGGGVCGLYAALRLLRRGAEVVLIEREERPGGLAAGAQHGGNWYDHGVHMLHAFDAEIFEDVRELMGDERLAVALDAKIRWAGSFYRYPLKFADMVGGIAPMTLLRCVSGLLAAHLREWVAPREAADAREALIQLYGKPLYAFFFEDFTGRYWGVPPNELSASFVRSKMPRLTAVDAIFKCLSLIGIRERQGRAVESALMEETLHYSAIGSEALPRALAAEVERLGGRVLCGSVPS